MHFNRFAINIVHTLISSTNWGGLEEKRSKAILSLLACVLYQPFHHSNSTHVPKTQYTHINIPSMFLRNDTTPPFHLYHLLPSFDTECTISTLRPTDAILPSLVSFNSDISKKNLSIFVLFSLANHEYSNISNCFLVTNIQATWKIRKTDTWTFNDMQ